MKTVPYTIADGFKKDITPSLIKEVSPKVGVFGFSTGMIDSFPLSCVSVEAAVRMDDSNNVCIIPEFSEKGKETLEKRRREMWLYDEDKFGKVIYHPHTDEYDIVFEKWCDGYQFKDNAVECVKMDYGLKGEDVKVNVRVEREMTIEPTIRDVRDGEFPVITDSMMVCHFKRIITER